MKKTTPLRVFVSVYVGLLLAGLIAFAIDAVHHIQFHWTHGYAIHGWDNLSFWTQMAVGYGLMGLPIVLILSYAVAWIVNLFVRGSK